MSVEKSIPPDQESTELRIKEAARRVFMRKGYAATRTRDIAEESGHNLALINYYFRSKEKLFELIMTENLQLFVASIFGIIDNEATTLERKLVLLVEHYVDMMLKHPDLPAFVMNAIHHNPQELLEKVTRSFNMADTSMGRQWHEQMAKSPLGVHPLHLLVNMVAMTIFPFVARPMIKAKIGLNDEQFAQLMQERKKLIPVWVLNMMKGQAEE